MLNLLGVLINIINICRIAYVPQNLSEMSYAIDYYNRLIEEVPIESGKFQPIYDQSDILDKYGTELDPEVKKQMRNIQTEWDLYISALEEADKMIQFTKVVIPCETELKKLQK